MENTRQLVEKINLLFVEGDMQGFMDYLADDVVWEMFTSSSGHITMNGKKEVFDMDSSDMPAHTGFQFGTIVVEGETASVQGTSTGKRKDGTDYMGHFCDVYHFRDSKIVKIESYVIDTVTS